MRECRNIIGNLPMQLPKQYLLKTNQSAVTSKKRLSQSFENPPAPKCLKSHSPNFDRVEWDKEKVITDLKEYKLINWPQFAREHGIPGSNGRQVVKQYAQQNGIDAQALDHRSPDWRLLSGVKD